MRISLILARMTIVLFFLFLYEEGKTQNQDKRPVILDIETGGKIIFEILDTLQVQNFTNLAIKLYVNNVFLCSVDPLENLILMKVGIQLQQRKEGFEIGKSEVIQPAFPFLSLTFSWPPSQSLLDSLKVKAENYFELKMSSRTRSITDLAKIR